jgi:LDH2 family malate/lactate/ureidoglycolate dehydrogenase
VPRSLTPIPADTPIVDKKGAINFFFRLAWQALIDAFQQVPTVAAIERLAQAAALVTTGLYTTRAAGLYRISWYLRKTVADGVSSSLTVTLGWTESALALTEAAPALATDTVTAQQSGSKLVYADESTDLTIAVAYASNTPGAMKWRLDASVEALT